jgi:hypothetical protein
MPAPIHFDHPIKALAHEYLLSVLRDANKIGRSRRRKLVQQRKDLCINGNLVLKIRELIGIVWSEQCEAYLDLFGVNERVYRKRVLRLLYGAERLDEDDEHEKAVPGEAQGR